MKAIRRASIDRLYISFSLILIIPPSSCYHSWNVNLIMNEGARPLRAWPISSGHRGAEKARAGRMKKKVTSGNSRTRSSFRLGKKAKMTRTSERVTVVVVVVVVVHRGVQRSCISITRSSSVALALKYIHIYTLWQVYSAARVYKQLCAERERERERQHRGLRHALLSPARVLVIIFCLTSLASSRGAAALERKQ